MRPHAACIFVQGATAYDPIEGDISSYVTACQPDARFARYGLQACTFSTAAPNNFTVSFAIADSASDRSVSAQRSVVVMPQCGPVEVPCINGLCSSGEVCLGSAPLQLPSNAAPTLALPPGANQIVYVPHGVPYKACTPAMLAQKLLCEQGMKAQDAEDGMLTPKVLACPPSDCLTYGCPGHEFAAKGVCRGLRICL